jgi:hypothetical protein
MALVSSLKTSSARSATFKVVSDDVNQTATLASLAALLPGTSAIKSFLAQSAANLTLDFLGAEGFQLVCLSDEAAVDCHLSAAGTLRFATAANHIVRVSLPHSLTR